jgi:hypothetical protein
VLIVSDISTGGCSSESRWVNSTALSSANVSVLKYSSVVACTLQCAQLIATLVSVRSYTRTIRDNIHVVAVVYNRCESVAHLNNVCNVCSVCYCCSTTA